MCVHTAPSCLGLTVTKVTSRRAAPSLWWGRYMLYQVVHVGLPKVLEIVIVLGYLLTDLYSPQIVFNKMTTTVVEKRSARCSLLTECV